MVYSESDLVLPSLRALAEHEDDGLSTAELQPILRRVLRPEGQDLELLEGRPDDRFSQKVRNLKSHNRLERDELAIFVDGRYYITEIGSRFADDFCGIDERYQEQGFSEQRKSDAIRPSNINVFVEEGGESNISTRARKRSRILRNSAMKYYAESDGKIRCKGCGFEGSEVYGAVALGLIEIHHVEPIALSQASFRQCLSDAVRKVVPLCPNCHRLVHRNPNSLMTMEQLRDLRGYHG